MSREMKHSGIPWIGDIPNHWEVDAIENLYSERKDKVSDKEYAPLSVTKNGVLPQLETAAKTDNGDDRKLVKVGDFAINSRSDRRGSCGISQYDGSVSLINTILTPKTEMNPQFYDWLFHTTVFADEFYKWGHGIVDDLWTTRWQEMKHISIVVPPLSEQKVIADYLDKHCAEVEGMVSLQEKIIEELRAYRQAIITETVTHGLNPNTPMKDSGVEWIGQIPQGWEVMRLKSIGKLYGGLSGKSGEDFNVDEEDDRYALFIPFTNIWNNDVISLSQFKKVKIEEGEPQNKVLRGDILFLMSSEDYGGLGKSCLMSDEVPNLYLNSFCKGFRVTSKNICSSYLNYLLLSNPIRNIIMSYGNGFIRVNLRAEKLICTPILLPPLPEQQAIADYLDKKTMEIDQLIAIKQRKIDELKEYKKSLIYEYVTGKKEVDG